jgi:hypothetical protein
LAKQFNPNKKASIGWIGSVASLLPSLVSTTALGIKLGELTKLNDQHMMVIKQPKNLDCQCLFINIGDLNKLGEPQVDGGTCCGCWYPCPILP